MVIVKPIIGKVFEAGDLDIVFSDQNSDRSFYINRGIETGLSIDELKAKLIGQRVTISYPSYWTIFDPKGKVKHLSRLEWNGELIYDETNGITKAD